MNTTRYYKRGQVNSLYHYKKDKKFEGVLYISATKPSVNLEKLSQMFLGLTTLTLITIFFPPLYSEISYRLNVSAKSIEQQIPPISEIPISEEFLLEIPKINLVSAIIPNVDTDNEQSYLEKLKVGVAHAKGSYFPGDVGPIVLFSHSTDSLAHIIQYNAAFYGLKDLEIGDKMSIRFKGKQFTYTITEKKIIDPTNLNFIRQSDSKLILITCWPPGTDWQRLVVFAS